MHRKSAVDPIFDATETSDLIGEPNELIKLFDSFESSDDPFQHVMLMTENKG